MSSKPDTKPTAPNVDPGAEAAEPSPGERQRKPEPSTEDLKKVDRMYEDKAKKLAEDGDAERKPAQKGR